jgi:hypothetical protein
VARELPPFVNTIRKHGLQVRTITCPITDADSPNAEAILQTASSIGVTHYWWGTFRYEQGKPIMPQLEALKPRVAKLAALNAKYKMTAMYHTYSGSGTVGAAIWDLLHVLKGRFSLRHWSHDQRRWQRHLGSKYARCRTVYRRHFGEGFGV